MFSSAFFSSSILWVSHESAFEISRVLQDSERLGGESH